MKEYVDLQSAHVTQLTTEKDGKSGWKVRKNITDDFLYELPGHFSEKDVFTVLDFARKFELIAFNAGIQFQKKITGKKVNTMSQENVRLSNVIENLTRYKIEQITNKEN